MQLLSHPLVEQGVTILVFVENIPPSTCYNAIFTQKSKFIIFCSSRCSYSHMSSYNSWNWKKKQKTWQLLSYSSLPLGRTVLWENICPSICHNAISTHKVQIKFFMFQKMLIFTHEFTQFMELKKINQKKWQLLSYSSLPLELGRILL